MTILTQDVAPVKGHLESRPILVCTLQRGTYLLDLSKDEFDTDDYIPFDGRPMHSKGQGWGGNADLGLEAQYR